MHGGQDDSGGPHHDLDRGGRRLARGALLDRGHRPGSRPGTCPRAPPTGGSSAGCSSRTRTTRRPPASVTYMIEGEGPQTFEKKVPANSRGHLQHGGRHRGRRTPPSRWSLDSAGHPREGDVPQQPQRGPRLDRHHHPREDYYLAEGHHRTGASPPTCWCRTRTRPPRTSTVTYMTPDGTEVAGPAFTDARQLEEDDKGERRPARTPTSPPSVHGSAAHNRRAGHVLGQRDRERPATTP